MKNIPFLLFFIISLHSPAQEIDCKANQKITDPDFKAFVDLLMKKSCQFLRVERRATLRVSSLYDSSLSFFAPLRLRVVYFLCVKITQ